MCVFYVCIYSIFYVSSLVCYRACVFWVLSVFVVCWFYVTRRAYVRVCVCECPCVCALVQAYELVCNLDARMFACM